MSIKFKPALTFEEQLKLMKSRGLVVKDDNFAVNVLSRVNYYKLSGYSLHMKNGDDYIVGTSFEDIYDTYMFNKKLSILIIDLLESIEGHFKISFANVLAKTYGANAHLLNSIYRNKHYFDNFLMLYEREKYKQSKVKFIQHNINKYGELPIWVAIEILSFGPISKLYKNLNLNDDKKDISEEFLSQKKASVTPYYLQNWLEVAGTLRNRCAHHSRVYNRTIPVTVNLHKTYINNGKRLSTSDIDRNSVFAVFLVIKRMVCKESQWSEIMLRLEELFTKYEHTIESQKMGFPENWRDYLFTELQAI